MQHYVELGFYLLFPFLFIKAEVGAFPTSIGDQNFDELPSRAFKTLNNFERILRIRVYP